MTISTEVTYSMEVGYDNCNIDLIYGFMAAIKKKSYKDTWIQNSDIGTLKNDFEMTLVSNDKKEYDEAMKIWNDMRSAADED